MTDTAVYAGIVETAEFQAKHPTPASVVTATYEAFLGRAPSAAELADSVAALEATSLPAFAARFLNSPEFLRNGYDQNIAHTVVIFQENWSFDSLFGFIPAADGIAQSSSFSRTQVDRTGATPYVALPPSSDVPFQLPNQPFDLTPTCRRPRSPRACRRTSSTSSSTRSITAS